MVMRKDKTDNEKEARSVSTSHVPSSTQRSRAIRQTSPQPKPCIATALAPLLLCCEGMCRQRVCSRVCVREMDVAMDWMVAMDEHQRRLLSMPLGHFRCLVARVQLYKHQISWANNCIINMTHR